VIGRPRRLCARQRLARFEQRFDQFPGRTGLEADRDAPCSLSPPPLKSIWILYARPPRAASILYETYAYLCATQRACRMPRHPGRPESIAMLDILYILIGAAFLAGCVLYAIACDRL